MRILLLLSVLLVVAGCRKEPPVPPRSSAPVDRVLLVYLAMDNANWRKVPEQNIADLCAGTTSEILAKGRIFIYKDVSDDTPVLLEIKINKQGWAEAVEVERYPEHNSADTAVFRKVFDRVQELAPAHSYGLDIGSHATGWIPGRFSMGASTLGAEPALDPLWLVRATANDQREHMELADFAAVLRKEDKLEYILFDACFMGGVESIYALRGKTRWIVASPAEVLIAGMPYRQIVGDLMAPIPNLRAVCEKYYYRYQTSSAAIALYDCSRMDILVETMRRIYKKYLDEIIAMDPAGVQHLTSTQFKTLIFDLEDFAACLMPATDPLHAALRRGIDDVVRYRAVTPMIMFDTSVDSARFCGLATYIPAKRMDAELTKAWMETEWADSTLNLSASPEVGSLHPLAAATFLD